MPTVPGPRTLGRAWSELVARYAERSPRSVTGVRWYMVLACYKLGIVLEGTHARACAGQTDVQTGQRLHAAAVVQLRRAGSLIEG